MSEWGKAAGGWIPHDEASTKEHSMEVGEDIRQEREAEQVAKAHRRRRWWKLWGRRNDPSSDPMFSDQRAGQGKIKPEQPPHPPPPGPGSIGTGV